MSELSIFFWYKIQNTATTETKISSILAETRTVTKLQI